MATYPNWKNSSYPWLLARIPSITWTVSGACGTAWFPGKFMQQSSFANWIAWPVETSAPTLFESILKVAFSCQRPNRPVQLLHVRLAVALPDERHSHEDIAEKRNQ